MTESSPLTLASYVSSEDDDLTGDAYYAMKTKTGYEMIGTKVRVVDDHQQEVAPSSIEVESILHGHASVQEAAIVSVPHEKWGEVPHAMVVLREGHIVTEDELIDFTRDHLAHFKCPKSITFLTEFPKTARGKIQKVQLRQQLDQS